MAVKVLRKWWEHALGFMFQTPRAPLRFEFSSPRRIRIHTWFVKGPIDVKVMRGKKVVDGCANLRPWRVWQSREKGDAFIESPATMFK